MLPTFYSYLKHNNGSYVIDILLELLLLIIYQIKIDFVLTQNCFIFSHTNLR